MQLFNITKVIMRMVKVFIKIKCVKYFGRNELVGFIKDVDTGLWSKNSLFCTEITLSKMYNLQTKIKFSSMYCMHWKDS